MLKSTLVIIGIAFYASVFSQLNCKTKEADEGAFAYCYHKNGKLSTEEFRPNSSAYGAQGYAKAYNYKGEEIYHKPTSRTAQLSSVHFTYHPNGAIKCAEYNSHPDAGIQWYRSFTYFDEFGIQTGFTELSHDMQVTMLHVPDSLYQREETVYQFEKLKKEKEYNEKLEKERNDSLTFYKSDTIEVSIDTTVIFIAEPINKLRKKQTLIKNKLISEEIIFYKPTDGIVKIERVFFKNGVCAEEFIYYHGKCHHKQWNKKGILVSEKYSCP